MSALEKALYHSAKIGIDECDVVRVKKKIMTIRITDSEIVEIKQNFDESFGIRLIQDKKIVSVHTTNEDEIEKTIDGAAINRMNRQTFLKKPVLSFIAESQKVRATH